MCMYVFMYECMYVYIINHEHKRIHVSVYYISELLVSAWENYPGVWSDFYRGLLEELLPNMHTLAGVALSIDVFVDTCYVDLRMYWIC